jgi:hypothetical protein
LPGAPSAQSGADGDLPSRVAAAQARLEALRDALGAGSASASLVGDAAGFGIVLPGVPFDAPPGDDDRNALASAVRGRLAAAQARSAPRDVLRALLGDGVLGVVAVTPPDASVLASALVPTSGSFGIDVTTCSSWLESMARVRPALVPMADVLAIAEISGRSPGPALRIAQAPFVANDPWVALKWLNPIAKAPAQGRLSLVLHAPAGVDAAQPLGGFLVDAWADAIPPAKRDTGLAIRNNGPNTRAPQTLLLAVAPDLSVPTWTAGMLSACLRDLLDAVVLRQGILFLYNPLIHLGHRTDGVGISYDAAGPPT